MTTLTGPQHFRRGLALLSEAHEAYGTPGLRSSAATLAALASTHFAACTAMAAAESALATMTYSGTIMTVGESEDDVLARRDAWGGVVGP